MAEVLQEREPSRRGVVVGGAALALLGALVLSRFVTGGGAPAPAPSASPAARARQPVVFTTTGSAGSAVDHGEYAYATTLRSAVAERVRVTVVTPLDDDGAELPAVVAVPLQGGSGYDRALGLREPGAGDGVDVEPGGEFVALVRVRPDCAARRLLGGLRVAVRWPDGSEQRQDLRLLDEPDRGLASLHADACADPPGEVGDAPLLALTGGGGYGPPEGGVVTYEFDVRATWDAPVTVLKVVPLDARGAPVRIESVAVMTADSGRAVTGPVEMRAKTAGAFVLGVRTTCDPPYVVAALRVTLRAGDETVERVLPLGEGGPRCG